jgi:hypothetical protein
MQQVESQPKWLARWAKRPSLLVQNFRLGNYYIEPPPGPLPFCPLPYFLYGDLLDPAKLMCILHIEKLLTLHLGISIGIYYEDFRDSTARVRIQRTTLSTAPSLTASLTKSLSTALLPT